MTEPTNTKWRLNMGCHRGTLTSRDSSCEEYGSKNDAVKAYQQAKDFWLSIGYKVWFAELIAPDGTKETLDRGEHYQ